MSPPQPRVLFSPAAVLSWSSFSTVGGVSFAGGPGVGCIPVYDTREECEAAHPGCEVNVLHGEPVVAPRKKK